MGTYPEASVELTREKMSSHQTSLVEEAQALQPWCQETLQPLTVPSKTWLLLKKTPSFSVSGSCDPT